MSEAEFIFRSMNTHQVLLILVVDTMVLSCVADSLQERRFASISPTDYKDTKALIFRSEFIGITVAHGRCWWVRKERLHEVNLEEGSFPRLPKLTSRQF